MWCSDRSQNKVWNKNRRRILSVGSKAIISFPERRIYNGTSDIAIAALLTLARKFETVHRNTVRINEIMPRVCLATPPNTEAEESLNMLLLEAFYNSTGICSAFSFET